MVATQSPSNSEPLPQGRAAPAATLWWLLHAALGGVLLAGMLLIVPRFASTFKDFDFELPAAAVIAVTISRLLVGGVLLVVPAFVLLLLFDWAVMYFLYARGRSLAAALWAVLWALLLLATLGLTAAGVILPMLSIMENLA